MVPLAEMAALDALRRVICCFFQMFRIMVIVEGRLLFSRKERKREDAFVTAVVIHELLCLRQLLSMPKAIPLKTVRFLIPDTINLRLRRH